MVLLTRRTLLKTAGIGIVAAAAGIPLAGCAADDAALRVGTKIDVPNFGFQNPQTGTVEGLEVDIARELARRIKGSPDAAALVGVNVTTRGAMIDNGTLDAVLATFSVTDERKRSYAFSRPYYIDHLGILVKQGKGLEAFEDLDGKTIGVALSATSKRTLEDAAREAGIGLHFAEYSTYPEIKIALVADRIDAFSVDRSILGGYVDDATELMDVAFAPQRYAVASSLDDPKLAAAIDAAIAAMQSDGVLAALQEKWGLASETADETAAEAEAQVASAARTGAAAPLASEAPAVQAPGGGGDA
ncbi:transporter substrate-binding domain-containing protein [Xiamenia xianingshaonis]|uniref:transporter substrate-binding domain-containing protein n=1 Tax=Xiamenia xianingshaonis TaxID=2682776 RepID=UPI0021BD1749|nr:transporter substrate-binding domain-containing protein [Xiamenia xianingshaonis]